mgnify:CR=1 FL=1
MSSNYLVATSNWQSCNWHLWILKILNLGTTVNVRVATKRALMVWHVRTSMSAPLEQTVVRRRASTLLEATAAAAQVDRLWMLMVGWLYANKHVLSDVGQNQTVVILIYREVENQGIKSYLSSFSFQPVLSCVRVIMFTIEIAVTLIGYMKGKTTLFVQLIDSIKENTIPFPIIPCCKGGIYSVQPHIKCSVKFSRSELRWQRRV